MTDLKRLDNESIEETLYRLGKLKLNKGINCTWDDIANALNEDFNCHYCESRYRKLFYQMKRSTEYAETLLYNTDIHDDMKKNVREIEKKRIQIQKEKNSYRKDLRTEALFDAILSCIYENVGKYEKIEWDRPENGVTEKAVYALLSDIHYGLTFDSFNSKYDTDIAIKRVLDYANSVVEIGKANNVNICYVSLLGDMISGIIHDQIRLENAENAVEQTIHVSELVAEFLKILSENFSYVIVNSVSGNHSRLAEKDNALRTERLDDIVYWYCRAKFENVPHVMFSYDKTDPTLEVFEIYGKTYVSVHGDFDQNVTDSSRRIAELLNKKVDYFISGHKHIAEYRIDNTGFIRNGAVVAGGDDYTSKKRLFGPAVQVCMLCSDKGVEAIYPVRL